MIHSSLLMNLEFFELFKCIQVSMRIKRDMIRSLFVNESVIF
jgi:hypothetical protein